MGSINEILFVKVFEGKCWLCESFIYRPTLFILSLLHYFSPTEDVYHRHRGV